MKRFLFMLTLSVLFIGHVFHVANAQNTATPSKQDFFNSILNAKPKIVTGTDEPIISEPHRATEELAAWLSGIIIHSLDIKATTPKEDVLKSKEHFTPKAYKEYLEFLSQQSYWLFITQRNYSMNASSTRFPANLCKQKINGVFTWIFEVPVIVNLIEDPNSPNATGKNASEIINLRIRLIRVQGMKPTPLNPHEVLISGWSLQDDSAILKDAEDRCM